MHSLISKSDHSAPPSPHTHTYTELVYIVIDPINNNKLVKYQKFVILTYVLSMFRILKIW